jgi:pimeloyl-ACP methyl ester carboxylesterase
VRLIGWSLGGYLAREAARDCPDLVHQVITLRSPVVGGPKYTLVAEAYRRRGIDLDEVEAQVEARNSVPLRTPVVAIYSRNDAVVEWEACIDRHCAEA